MPDESLKFVFLNVGCGSMKFMTRGNATVLQLRFHPWGQVLIVLCRISTVGGEGQHCSTTFLFNPLHTFWEDYDLALMRWRMHVPLHNVLRSSSPLHGSLFPTFGWICTNFTLHIFLLALTNWLNYWINNYMEHNPSEAKICSSTQDLLGIYWTRFSLLCLQESYRCPYPMPDESSLPSSTLFLKYPF
jgi:hypothetical protein